MRDVTALFWDVGGVILSNGWDHATRSEAARCFELNAEDIVCDYRPASGVRFSPHFYTTDEEIDEAFVVLDNILRTGRWKRQEARQTIVT